MSKTTSHNIDQMIVELKAAGWTPVKATRWRDPHGDLHVGPAGAYRTLKALQALTCDWNADDDLDAWRTSCGHLFALVAGTPQENVMQFCCYCGRALTQLAGAPETQG